MAFIGGSARYTCIAHSGLPAMVFGAPPEGGSAGQQKGRSFERHICSSPWYAERGLRCLRTSRDPRVGTRYWGQRGVERPLGTGWEREESVSHENTSPKALLPRRRAGKVVALGCPVTSFPSHTCLFPELLILPGRLPLTWVTCDHCHGWGRTKVPGSLLYKHTYVL